MGKSGKTTFIVHVQCLTVFFSSEATRKNAVTSKSTHVEIEAEMKA